MHGSYWWTADSGPLKLLFSIVLIICVLQTGTCSGSIGAESVKVLPDWNIIAQKNPTLKTLVVVEAANGLTLRDLAVLADKGMVPADRDPGLIVGMKKAVFSTTAQRWISSNLPRHISARLAQKFLMSGIYRVSFRVDAKNYDGPLNLEVTAPREDVGKRLISSEVVVRPTRDLFKHEDSAGNRWVSVKIPRVRYGDEIKFHFSFTYEVDVARVIDHDLIMSDKPEPEELNEELKEFLKRGYKIDPDIPQASKWASVNSPFPVDARHEYRRLDKFLKEKVVYDDAKRATYFGGRSVYSDLDHMYQYPSETLSRGLGCCPDTVLLECSFMRAKGIPCRTAGRFGHFFSEVYLLGRGWKSTSTTPTGIPLIVSIGPDHVPYQKWEPAIPIRTTRWEARVRIEPQEDYQ